MALIKIPPGAYVLLTTDPKARPENIRRAVAIANQYGSDAANEARLVPPWFLLIHGEREALAPLMASGVVRKEWPYHPAPERVTVEVGAFNWHAADFRPAYAVAKFPHDFIHPSYVETVGAWLETSTGATITTEQGDDIASASDAEAPSKPRRKRAANPDAA